ncbi:hypothetical protein [Polyangium mundeleinium]|uniref:Exo-alpha-sialidase n=1 Tax=Polyangium mundeleinium TaxID=2995306 RepID=A0ABT5EQS9_9BACT|nr:hypothetical protein [Polyangium mundeleinium]MDC0743699.1 hypothetical protein [Polyangium mundeleinium]
MKRLRASLLLLGLGALGCGEVEIACDDPAACTCGPTRALPQGGCCPAWTVADGEVCRARTWIYPAPSQAISGPGARRVSASIDGRGRGLFVWDEATTPGADVIVVAEETDAGLSLRKPSAVLPGFAGMGVVLGGEAGDAVVSWRQSITGGEGDVHRSERAPDGTWTDPMSPADRVSFGVRAYEPRLATRPSGEMLQVWNQWFDGSHFGVAIARRRGPGEAWEGPSAEDDVLSPVSFFSNAPQVTVNSRGDALVSWYQSAGSQLMAFMSERLGAEGAFSRPGVDAYLSAPGAPVDNDPVCNPKPALAEDGRGVVVWTQETGQGGVAVYLASRDASGTWTRPADLADTFSRPAGKCRDARAAFDGLGHLYVTWSEDTGTGPVVHLAQRAPDGAWIHPGDRPLVLSTEGATQAITPVLAVGRDGGVIVVWSEEVGDHFRVAARRGSAAGFGLLEVLSPAGDHALTPHVAVGGPGDRAVVAWIHGEPTVGRVLFATLAL